MRPGIMDPVEAERLLFQRMRLFMVETETIQASMDSIVAELEDGREVPGSRVKGIADRLRNARSRLGATLGEDAA